MSWKLILAVLTSFIAAPAVAQEWDDFGESQVVWSKGEGLDKIRFYTGSASDGLIGCSTPTTDLVKVLSVDAEDDYFRGRSSKGVETYRVNYDDLPQVLKGWVRRLTEEDQTVRVTAVTCGQGGYVYVTELERTDK